MSRSECGAECEESTGDGSVRSRKRSVAGNEVAVWVTVRGASPTHSGEGRPEGISFSFTEGKDAGRLQLLQPGPTPSSPQGALAKSREACIFSSVSGYGSPTQ